MPIVLKSENLDLLELLGPVQACNGILENLKDHLAYSWQGYVVKIPRLSDWQIREAIMQSPHLAVDFRYSCHQMSAFQTLFQTTDTEVTRYK